MNIIDKAKKAPAYAKLVFNKHYGDWLRNLGKVQPSNNLNDNINLANKLSIVSDPYSNEHFLNMRYVTFMGAKWKVTDIEVKYPRLILTIGGVYNGK
jgi:exoribonuclease II